MRRLLLAVFALGIMGTGAELVLLEPSWFSWSTTSPGSSGCPWPFWRSGSARRPPSTGVPDGVPFSRCAGSRPRFCFPRRSAYTFTLKRTSSSSGSWTRRGGSELVWDVLTGAMPALAPGSMALLGLIGFVITAGHPALQPGNGETDV